jgi:hypothetical protein
MFEADFFQFTSIIKEEAGTAPLFAGSFFFFPVRRGGHCYRG